MPRRVTKVFLEPARHWVIRPLTAIVPFAKRSGRIPGSLKGLGNCSLLEVEPLLSQRDAVDAATRMIAPRKKFRSRRSTDRTNEESIECYAVLRNCVNVGRADLRIAVLAVITPTCIVGKEDNDIRMCKRCGTTTKEK